MQQHLTAVLVGLGLLSVVLQVTILTLQMANNSHKEDLELHAERGAKSLEKIARERGRYVRYLQGILNTRGVQFKQELEYLDDEEIAQFNSLMDRRTGL